LREKERERERRERKTDKNLARDFPADAENLA
jgi:hypothetical protein